MFSVFSSLFHEGYMMVDGTTSNAQNHDLKRSRPVIMLKTKYICHIKYDGNQFRYVAQERIHLSSKSKSGKLF